MSSLSLYLPPFASDYSGACSALFDYNCVLLVNDPSCCTGNYVDYDEPRWSSTKKAALSANLRMRDAIFGVDDKVSSQIEEASASLEPDFVAIAGSPVPAIIGTDMPGLARESESQTGIPTFGFSTTGFSYYTDGITNAILELIKRFAPNERRGFEERQDAEPHAIRVNICGMTPLDFGVENYHVLEELLANEGMLINASLGMGGRLDDVKALDEADLSIAVSFAGIPIAERIQELYGIPYIASALTGSREAKRVCNLLKSKDVSTTGMRASAKADDGDAKGDAIEESPMNASVLLVGDQVIMSSIRNALRLAGLQGDISVASFFGIDKSIAEESDIHVKDELALMKLLDETEYDAIVADPLIKRLPTVKESSLIELPHPAISSRLFWDGEPIVIGVGLDPLLESMLDRISTQQ